MARLRTLVAAAVLGLTALPAVAAGSDVERTIHVPEGWEGAYDFGYAPVVRVGETVIVSGVPASGDGSYEDKIRRMYERVEELLAAAGASIDDVVELTTFHTAPRDSPELQAEFKRYMPIHREFFGEHRPAWTAVGTTVLLSPSAPVEMRVVAVVGSGAESRVVRGAASETDAAAASPLLTTGRFELWSDPEINLHYFLYQLAAAEEPRLRRRHPVPVAELEEIDELAGEERAAWRRALDHYREHVAERNPVFDRGLDTLRDHLSGTAPAPDDELVRSTLAVLEPVLPFYRRRWWPEHDADNRRFVEALEPLLLEVEDGLGERMAAVLGGRWPDRRVRLDISAYANDLEAYSTTAADAAGPHVVMSSRAPGYQGPAGVEMIFHESGHGEVLIGALGDALRSAARAAGAEDATHDISHTVLFYTAGELAREAFRDAGIEDYVPFAEANRLWRGHWAPFYAAFEAHWRPYLEGETTREEAIEAVVRALAAGAADERSGRLFTSPSSIRARTDGRSAAWSS